MPLGRLQDFHTAVAGALSGGEYVERLYQAMAAEAADELAASEQRAAKRALRKAELKVRGILRGFGRLKHGAPKAFWLYLLHCRVGVFWGVLLRKNARKFRFKRGVQKRAAKRAVR